jgi:hypothetical protein
MEEGGARRGWELYEASVAAACGGGGQWGVGVGQAVSLVLRARASSNVHPSQPHAHVRPDHCVHSVGHWVRARNAM